VANIVKTYTFVNGQPADATQVNKNFDDLLAGINATAQAVWPVGSVFTSVVATNPNTLLGFGTWAGLAAGRVLVGLDSGDANFDAVKEIGGTKTVAASAQSFTGQTAQETTGPLTYSAVQSGAGINAAGASHVHQFTAAGTNAAGAATSVVQPYFVVYFWERTA